MILRNVTRMIVQNGLLDRGDPAQRHVTVVLNKGTHKRTHKILIFGISLQKSY